MFCTILRRVITLFYVESNHKEFKKFIKNLNKNKLLTCC